MWAGFTLFETQTEDRTEKYNRNVGLSSVAIIVLDLPKGSFFLYALRVN